MAIASATIPTEVPGNVEDGHTTEEPAVTEGEPATPAEPPSYPVPPEALGGVVSGQDVMGSFPESCSLGKVDWPEGDLMRYDASGLYRVLGEMARTLWQQQKDIRQPSWMPEVMAKVDQAGRLSRRFEKLTEITNELLELAGESPAKVRLKDQLEALSKPEKPPAPQGGPSESPDELHAKVEGLGKQIEEVGRRACLAANASDIAQLRELITERSKSIQVHVAEKQNQDARALGAKIGELTTQYSTWQQKVQKQVRNRFDALKTRAEEVEEELASSQRRVTEGMASMSKKLDHDLTQMSERQDAHEDFTRALQGGVRALEAEAVRLGEEDQRLGSRLDFTAAELEAFRIETGVKFDEHGKKQQDQFEQLTTTLYEHRQTLNEHTSNHEQHALRLAAAEKRLGGVNRTLVDHLKTLEDHGERVVQLEGLAAKAAKDIKGIKRDADERQTYMMNKVEEVNSKVGKLQKWSVETGKRVETLRGDADGLLDLTRKHTSQVTTLEEKTGSHQETLEVVVKHVTFLKSKMKQLDDTTDEVAHMSDKVDEHSVKIEEFTEQFDKMGEDMIAQDQAREAVLKQLKTFRGMMDEEVVKLKEVDSKQQGAMDKLKNEMTELQEAQDDVIVALASKNKKPEVGAKLGAQLSTHKARQEARRECTQGLARLSLAFEKLAAQKKKVQTLDEFQAQELAIVAMEVAEYLTNLVNVQSIRQVLLLEPDSPPVTDEDISQLRENTVQSFLSDLRSCLQEDAPLSKDSVKHKARTVFQGHIYTALDMAMSKYDQVVVPASSLLSRAPVPTCVACDRPLPGKKRAKDLYGTVGQESPYDLMRTDPNESEGSPLRRPQETTVALCPQTSSDGSAMPPLPEVVRRPATSSAAEFNPDSMFATGSAMPISNAAERASGAAASGAVYRGGFKFPKAEGDGALPKLADLSFSTKERQRKWTDQEDPRGLVFSKSTSELDVAAGSGGH